MTSPDPTATGTTAELASLTGTWELDPPSTSIEFQTKALWIMKVKGTAKPLIGGGAVGDDGNVSGRFVVDVKSVDTNNQKRDAHLQSEDFFDAAKYPTIEFELSSLRFLSPGRVELKGNLSIHGQSQPISVPADVEINGSSATLATEIDIDRSVWGISWAKMGAGLKNKVVIKAKFNKTAS